ncbi:MAG: hypothetical protein AMXMBFR33_21750 [Candidatus Xenobia bacterium]
MNVSLVTFQALSRPSTAAYVARPKQVQDSFQPTEQGLEPSSGPGAPAPALVPLQIRTYVPCAEGFQEVHQFPIDRYARPVLSRFPEGKTSFIFPNQDGLHSVQSGGRLNFLNPLPQSGLKGLQVRPEDGHVFVLTDGMLQELDPTGQVLMTRPTAPGQTLLMANTGSIYLSSDETLEKLGGPSLKVGGPVSRVAELASGHTAVEEWQASVVRVFDPEGKQTLATPSRTMQASLSTSGKLVYSAEDAVHTYDVSTARKTSFPFKGYLEDLLPLANGDLAVHVRSDLTRADLIVLESDGSEKKRFAIKDGCMEDLQATPDGKSLLGTIDRWHRKTTSTDLVRFDLEEDGLGTRLGQLLGNEHGQTVVHSVPEKEGLVAGVLPTGDLVVVERRGAFLNGRPVGDQAALEARLGPGARLHTSDNLLSPNSSDLDGAFRSVISIRPQAELDRFYRGQGGVPGNTLEFPGAPVERLPGPDLSRQSQAAVVKSLLSVDENQALKEGVLPFGGPGGALLRTSAHELTVELPTGEDKFRSFSLVCEWEDFGGGTHWEESWTHAQPVQVGERYYLCAANDRKQVFFFDLNEREALIQVDLDSDIRSMALSDGRLVVGAEDGTHLVIEPPRREGDRVYEGDAAVDPGAGNRVIETVERVQVGGVTVRKRQGSR